MPLTRESIYPKGHTMNVLETVRQRVGFGGLPRVEVNLEGFCAYGAMNLDHSEQFYQMALSF